jgi:sulfonate transport system permease protein
VTTAPLAASPIGIRRVRVRRSLPAGAERLLGVVVLLAAWELASGSGVLSSQTLAGPVQVWRSGWHLAADGTLGPAVWASLQRVLVGLAIGVLIGTALAVIAGVWRLGEDLLDTPIQMLRFLPIIGLQPLVVLWLGIGNTAKISLIVFGVVFPIYINTFNAVRAIDPKHRELAEVSGLSRLGFIRKVVLPGALPGWLVGIRIAVAAAWLLLVFCEQINATNGIGYLIVKAQTFFQTDVIVVGLAVYAVLGLLCDVLVRFLERKALSWQPGR